MLDEYGWSRRLITQLGFEGKAVRKVVIGINAHRVANVVVYGMQDQKWEHNVNISLEDAQDILKKVGIDKCTSLTIVINPTYLIEVHATCIVNATLSDMNWSIFKKEDQSA